MILKGQDIKEVLAQVNGGTKKQGLDTSWAVAFLGRAAMWWTKLAWRDQSYNAVTWGV